MDHSQLKSMFLLHQKGIWDPLTVEEQLRAIGEWVREELVTQLATANQKVAELALVH